MFRQFSSLLLSITLWLALHAFKREMVRRILNTSASHLCVTHPTVSGLEHLKVPQALQTQWRSATSCAIKKEEWGDFSWHRSSSHAKNSPVASRPVAKDKAVHMRPDNFLPNVAACWCRICQYKSTFVFSNACIFESEIIFLLVLSYLCTFAGFGWF